MVHLPRPTRSGTRTALLAVALVALLAASGVTLAWRGEAPLAPLPPELDVEQGAGPTADFLAAFERSRTVTYTATEVLERQRSGGVALSSASTVTQRPPDRLVRSEGTIEGIRGGSVVQCTGDRCLRGSEPVDYAAEVATQVANLAGLVEGRTPVYAVGAEAGATGAAIDHGQDCYLLDLLRQVPAPPFGTFARFCFDRATGIPMSIRVEGPDLVDQTETGGVSTTVSDEDLRLPVDD